MKTSILFATSSIQAVQAAQATGSIVNDGCEAIKWNGEKIPFQDQLLFLCMIIFTVYGAKTIYFQSSVRVRSRSLIGN